MKSLEDIHNDLERFKADTLSLERFLTGTRVSYSFFKSQFPEVEKEFGTKERSEEEAEGMRLFENLHSSVDTHEIEVFKYCFINLIARTDAYLNDVADSIYKSKRPELTEDQRRKLVLKYSHSSFKSKLDHLEREFGLSFPYVEKHKVAIVEFYSTRNLILHNDGKVNETYLKLNQESELELGSRRVVDEDYLKLTFVIVTLIARAIFEQVSQSIRQGTES